MQNESSHSHTNSLIHESSPYLLQHAHNPVNWMPWGEEALALAKKENKPIIVSIGYSACHWCHVMEQESFEDAAVAELMNRFFINVKVDREERPDIDQIYMNAVQLMTGRGGWPLNCILTPDGRPFYGGTYFPKSQWLELLKQLHEIYTNDPDKVEDYANKLTNGIQQTELIKKQELTKNFNFRALRDSIEKCKQHFDVNEGGESKTPKFPMPNNYQFLLHYFYNNRDQSILEHLEKSLQKMAFGGIYDQIGGGFARYSTDEKWKVPHFEKMLYDNAQMVSLYSEAYRLNKNPLYKEVVYETLKFISEEMTDENGAFYSALDADSEGIEGRYYVWKKEELEEILNDDFPLFADYYNINKEGYWEDGNYILLRKKTDEEFVRDHKLEFNEFKKKVNDWKSLLLEHRQKRTKPGLDDKTLTSWNTLMIKGYVGAYKSFGEDAFLEAAINNGNFIVNTLLQEDGRLYHSYKSGKSSVNAFLEDYSFSIEAFLALYEVTFNENWLIVAKKLAEYAYQHFYDEETSMFFFTSVEDLDLIARKTEVADNVIPSSNSSMAKSLFLLSKYLEDVKFEKIAQQMMHNMEEHLLNYPLAYTNWGMVYLNYIFPFYEIAIVGEKYNEKAKELFKNYLPNSLILGGTKTAKLSLLKNKYTEGKTKIFVCENKVCQAPVIEVTEALKQIDQH